jgi:hypothetical protein
LKAILGNEYHPSIHPSIYLSIWCQNTTSSFLIPEFNQMCTFCSWPTPPKVNSNTRALDTHFAGKDTSYFPSGEQLGRGRRVKCNNNNLGWVNFFPCFHLNFKRELKFSKPKVRDFWGGDFCLCSWRPVAALL